MEKTEKNRGCIKGTFLIPIQIALIEGPLSGKELYNKSKKLIEPLKVPKAPERSFKEGLLCLLHHKKIQIDQYSFDDESSRTTRQSLTYEGFTYSLVKTNKSDILILINKSANIENTCNDSKEARNEIKRLFNKKVQQIVSENFDRWDIFSGELTIKTPSNEELAWFLADKDINSELEEHPELANINDLEYYDKIQMKMNKYLDNLNLIKDYKKVSLLYDNLSLVLLNSSESFKRPECEHDHLKSFDPQCADPMPHSINKDYLFIDVVSEDYFFEYNGYIKPIEWNDNEIENLFQDILFNIYNNKNKKELISKLATALSEDENSNEKFNELVLKISNKSLIKHYSFNNLKRYPFKSFN